MPFATVNWTGSDPQFLCNFGLPRFFQVSVEIRFFPGFGLASVVKFSPNLSCKRRITAGLAISTDADGVRLLSRPATISTDPPPTLSCGRSRMSTCSPGDESVHRSYDTHRDYDGGLGHSPARLSFVPILRHSTTDGRDYRHYRFDHRRRADTIGTPAACGFSFFLPPLHGRPKEEFSGARTSLES
ncbi:hypothetical protein K438DRAFT_1941240 [Mycena galopus ATCC 62051]|nr:hypothetical protein K438DRAFT_1941240 [Mycena galopus ATCC 62051]